jgi:ABC-type Fe3+ transport system substrate-binding protein
MVLYYNEKLLDPLKPALMLPDVLDPSKWKKGKLWFDDPEQTHVLRLINSLGANFYVNSHSVKPGDLRSMKDLLTPKWKEKVSFDDPTVPGKGNGTSTRLYFQMGEEAVKKLYMDQKPAISRDGRQLADWLARGTYPISFDAPSEEVKRLQKDGLPVGVAPPLSDFPGYVTSATGLVALMNKAPHSNGAKLFVNWIASQEGLQVFARAIEAATTRIDVDETFLAAGEIPRPGIIYFDNGSWEYTLQKEKIRLWMKELLKR